MTRWKSTAIGMCIGLGAWFATAPVDADVTIIDLADLVPGTDPFIRVLGPDRDGGTDLGVTGVPVAAGFDLDGDGFRDYAIAHYLASPLGRNRAGRVTVVFGNGTIGEVLDTESTNPRLLTIIGAGAQGADECTGSELWMGDVTGDGLGDLIVCRQNFSMSGRNGAGAVTIVVGSPALRDLADAGTIIDLANPPPSVDLFTLIGRHSYARLGIWARTGDVDGDGITDFVVASDQEDVTSNHNGAAYVVRGGPHLATTATVDLASFGSTILAGNLARIIPPAPSNEYHFGGTCQMGDLDGNGRAEVMAAAVLNRAGASIGPFGSSHGSGGPSYGRLYVVWDDAFPAVPWPAGFLIDLDSPPAGSLTTISGAPPENGSFGEEILGGLDYSGDGNAELFIGDLVGDGFGGARNNSGIGYVIYHAALIKGLTFDINSPPAGIDITTVVGPSAGAIGSDTAGHGDLNGDGIADLMIGNPTDDAGGRSRNGSISVLMGQATPWPALIDTAPGAYPASIDAAEIQGALGTSGSDLGDTLCYSAALGDLDADGRMDIIANEMLGNGASSLAEDSGNLVVVSGLLFPGPPPPTDPVFVRGDANVDGSVNIADAIAVLTQLFGMGIMPCDLALDVNDDEGLDIADPIYLLSSLFTGGPSPATPFPSCGTDATLGALECGAFALCP